MTKEPHNAVKKEPEAIQPVPSPGPDYDPMDLIVQDLQNVQSFMDHLLEHPEDTKYLDTHLSKILGMRRTVAHQLDFLLDEPYDYTPSRIALLKKENERVFTYVEGAVGAMVKKDKKELKRFVEACEQVVTRFDGDLTP